MKAMAARRDPKRLALFNRGRHDQEIHQEGLWEQTLQLRPERRRGHRPFRIAAGLIRLSLPPFFFPATVVARRSP
jgi:hypothetical protein